VVRAAPWLFVALWSTGFVSARYATDDAGPLSFLAARFLLASALLAVAATAMRAPRPTVRQAWSAAGTGLLLHALYLGGVFVAINRGLPTGVSALIAGLHPVVTALASGPLLNERLTRAQWAGVGLGFVGVVVVVADRLQAGVEGVTAAALVASVVAVAGMSSGTMLQRATGADTPLLWGTVVQYLAAATVMATAARAFEGPQFRATAASLGALAWAVLVLSIASVLLMMWLLQRKAASTVTSLFFLTPGLSIVESAIIFGERLGPAAVVGVAVAAVGVWLVSRRPQATANAAG
jgi:drug/metabolite transporter (DMT)-like permease